MNSPPTSIPASIMHGMITNAGAEGIAAAVRRRRGQPAENQRAFTADDDQPQPRRQRRAKSRQDQWSGPVSVSSHDVELPNAPRYMQ